MSVSGIFSSGIGNNQASVASYSTSNRVAQAFQQFSTDLKSGNLSGARQDDSAIQRNPPNSDLLRGPHGHRHLKIDSTSDQSHPLQDLNQLSQDLDAGPQSRSVMAAQQAYASGQTAPGAGTQSDAPNFFRQHLQGPSMVGLHSPMPPVFHQAQSFVA